MISSPAPTDKTIEPPPPTSRKRHDSINSAKMHNNNVHVVQEIPSAKEAGVLNHNTGFPEPLSTERNTTLPHPEADTSKNATIEAADIPLARTHSRGRGFLHRHHSHVTNKGKIDPSETGVYDGVHYVNGSKEMLNGAKIVVKESEAMNGVTSNGVANGVVEDGRKGESSEEEALRLEKEKDEQDYPEGERKKGVLRKLHMHKV